MNIPDFLPAGSIVLLKGAQKKLMVIGLLIQVNDKEGNTHLFDYVGLPWPEGYFAADSLLYFNHDQIETIVSPGFRNEESQNLVDFIKSSIEKAAAEQDNLEIESEEIEVRF